MRLSATGPPLKLRTCADEGKARAGEEGYPTGVEAWVKESFVVVATYWGVVEAKMASELLAGEGIAARLADDGIAGANPFLAPAIGGVRVLVPAHDARKAGTLLQARGLTPGGEPPSLDMAALEDEATEAAPADESVGEFLKSKKRRG